MLAFSVARPVKSLMALRSSVPRSIVILVESSTEGVLETVRLYTSSPVASCNTNSVTSMVLARTVSEK